MGRYEKQSTIQSSLVSHSITLLCLSLREGWVGIYAPWSPDSLLLLFLADGCSISRWPPPGTLAKKRKKKKGKTSPGGESQQSLLKRGAAEKPTSDDTWNKFRAVKKGRHTERWGELFPASARPRAHRTLQSAALLRSTFKTKFTFWTLNFSNGAAAFSSHFHPTSNEHEGMEKRTLPYLGLFEKTKVICRHISVNSGYYASSLRVRLPAEFTFFSANASAACWLLLSTRFWEQRGCLLGQKKRR